MGMAAAARISSCIDSPGEHFQAFASDPRFTFVLWRKQEKKAWVTLKANVVDIRSAINDLRGQEDVYVTPNEFLGWRQSRLLQALNAFYVDLDLHDDRSLQLDPGAVMGLVHSAIERIEAARIPTPNFIVYTGRGAHLYWCFDKPVTKYALPRWTALEKHLTKILRGDKHCSDCTRVLRLVGTKNSAALEWGETKAEVLHSDRYDFDWLCDQIFHLPRAEIRDLRAARALREAAEAEPKGEKKKRVQAAVGLHEVARHRFMDLMKLVDTLYWFGNGVPEGKRDTYLFHIAVNLAWFLYPQSLEDELSSIAAKHMSLTPHEVKTYIRPVVSRAYKAAAGATSAWNGGTRDIRYCYSRKSLWDIFGDEVQQRPDLINEMRAIVPDDLVAERKTARNRARSADHYTGKGVTASNEGKLAQARSMAQQGASMRAIAKEIGLSVQTVSRWLKADPQGVSLK
jgi:hypothetical protein